MRDQSTMYRKPVSFSEYYFLVVKLHGIWCFDVGTWDYEEIRTLEHEAQKLYGKSSIKSLTSPSDDSNVTNKIVREMNRYSRIMP